MSSIVKRVFTALFGLIYGGLSFYWNLLGIVFVIPDCTPDSKEWEEYTLCLPIGIMMLLVWLALTAFILFKFRKNKALLFFVMMIIGAAILLVVVQSLPSGNGPFSFWGEYIRS